MRITAENTILKACDLRRGMVVLPFKGQVFPEKDPKNLDWRDTMYSEWWQHIVIGSELTGDITLARPHAYAHDHFDSNSPLLACEVYHVSKGSDTPYMLLRSDFTT